MTSYIQTTQFQQETLNLQVLRWVLPIAKIEEVNDSLQRETESKSANWSSLCSLSSTKESTTDLHSSSVPPPTPISKKSKFSTKNSLDMCTETLGCETGTMYTTDDYKRDRIGSLTQEEAEERRRERKETVERSIKRVKTFGTEFPPALTTRTRENFTSIVREREDGRMIMYAMKQYPTVRAERRDGRLKLHLLSSNKGEVQESQEETGRTTGEEDEGGEVDYLGVVGKEMNGNVNGCDELEGSRKYVFVGRCKEEEQRGDWMPLRVASAL